MSRSPKIQLVEKEAERFSMKFNMVQFSILDGPWVEDRKARFPAVFLRKNDGERLEVPCVDFWGSRLYQQVTHRSILGESFI